MTVDLDKLEELARAATPGPHGPICSCADCEYAKEQLRAAANPAAVLELLDMLERQRAGFQRDHEELVRRLVAAENRVAELEKRIKE